MQLLTMLQCPSVIHALIFMFEEVLIAWQVQLDILSCLFLCKYNYTEHSQVRNYLKQRAWLHLSLSIPAMSLYPAE